MAKTKINGNLWRLILAIGTIVLGAGVYCATVRSNTERIGKVEVQASQTEKEFVEFRGEMRTSILNIEKGIQRIEEKVEN